MLYEYLVLLFFMILVSSNSFYLKKKHNMHVLIFLANFHLT